MKKKEKIMVIVLVAIAVLAIVFVVNRNNTKNADLGIQQPQQIAQPKTTVEKPEFTQDLGNGTIINTSNKLNSAKSLEGIEISNIQLTKTANTSQILATAKNTTSNATQFQVIKLRFVDKAGKEIKTTSFVIKALEPGETTQLNTTVSYDFVNAYDFVIEK